MGIIEQKARMYLNSEYNRNPEVVKEPKDYDYKGNMFLTKNSENPSKEETENTENPSKEETSEPSETEPSEMDS